MKNFLYLLLVGFCFVTISCATQQQSQALEQTTQTSQDFRLRIQSNANLADALRKNTNLTVLGQGSDTKVILRGTSSFGMHGQHTQPLYVVDGVAIGNSYTAANRMINPNEIVSIRILRNLSEVSTYGEKGNHGVIKIRTAKNSND